MERQILPELLHRKNVQQLIHRRVLRVLLELGHSRHSQQIVLEKRHPNTNDNKKTQKVISDFCFLKTRFVEQNATTPLAITKTVFSAQNSLEPQEYKGDKRRGRWLMVQTKRVA